MSPRKKRRGRTSGAEANCEGKRGAGEKRTPLRSNLRARGEGHKFVGQVGERLEKKGPAGGGENRVVRSPEDARFRIASHW